MTEFEFDIQRFATTTVTVGTATELTNAIANLTDTDTTIQLTADISLSTTLNIKNNVNAIVTIDTNGHKINFTTDGTISIPEDANVTFTGNGSISADSGYTVTIDYYQSAAPTFTSGLTLDSSVSKNVRVKTATELTDAIADLDGTDTTIELNAAISDPDDFTIAKNVTIKLGNNTLSYSSDHTIKIAKGAEVTFKRTGGSISPADGVDVIIEYTDTAPTMDMTAASYSGVLILKVVEVGTAEALQNDINDLDGTTDTLIRLTADITNATDLNITGSQTVVIDMNDHSIAYSDDGEITIDKASTVKFKNGGSGITVAESKTLTIEYYQSNAPDFGNAKFSGDGDVSKLVKVSSYSELVSALADLDGTETTIQFTQSFAAAGTLTIPANQNVTVDLNGYTYTMSYSDSTVTVGDSTVTITGGTIARSGSVTAAIANSGELTIDNMTLTDVSLTSSSGVIAKTTSSNVTLSAGSSYVERASPTANLVTYATSSSSTASVTFTFDDAASVKMPDTGAIFTVTESGETVTYNMDSGGLRAVYNGVTKVYRGSNTTIPMTELAFTGTKSELVEVIIMDSGNANFTFQKSTTGNLTPGADAVPVASYTDYKTDYGNVKKNVDDTFSLSEKSSTTWTSVTISDGSTVGFTSDFTGTTIIVNDGTTFTSTGGTSFTVSSANSDYVSIFGANASLSTGTIQTATCDQTIAAGNYSVGGYSGSTTANDGINVIISDGSTLVSDIDDGESFSVNGIRYTKNTIGLTTADTLNNIVKLYTGPGYDTITSGIATTIDLSTLAASMREFITPSASSSAILTLGGANNYSAVVLNYSASSLGDGSNAVKFAELKASDDKKSYVLDTIENGNVSAFRSAVDTIYVDGVTATLDATLIGAMDSDISGKKMTIATRMGTRFIVMESDYNFSVNGNVDAPEVIGAKRITLLEGSITTYNTTNTVITVGEDGPVLKDFSSGMTVTLRDNKIIIKGGQGKSFYFNEEPYSILGGSGMTFTFGGGSADLVFSELSVVDGDAFAYNGKNYSVKGAGFIRNDGYMWTGGTGASPHVLDGGSVSAASLAATGNWGKITTVATVDASVVLPLGTNTITLVGADYNKIYGVFSGASGAYTLDGVTETVNTAELGSVTVQGGMRSLSATEDLTNVTVYSPIATFAVTDDNGNGWGVKLDGSAVSAITPDENITLLSGTFQVDSDTDVKLAVANSIISAGNSSNIIVTGDGSDATISGLGKDESFNIFHRGDYTMKAVGLVKDDQYLFGSKNTTVKLSDISTASLWGALISASALTINSSSTNAIIVDATENTIYADLVVDGTNISMRKADGGYPWDSSNIIYVDNTTVNFTSDFAGIVNNSVSIAGIQSDATVNVTEINPFTFKDAGTGAVIGSVSAYNLTGGTVSVTANQTVTADTTVLSADTGDVTFNVSGSGATIGAVDVTDIFSVNGTQYRRYGVGIMTTADDKLLTDLNSAASFSVAELNASDPVRTITVTDSVLTVSPTVTAGLSYIVIDPDKTARYGMITVIGSGGYSMWKDSQDSPWNSNYTISADDQRVTLTTDYLGMNLRGVKSGAEFQVLSLSSTSDSNFSFYDVYTGATLSPEVSSVTQTAGLIAPQDNQSIFVGSNQITDTDTVGSILVSVSSGAATITGIDSGEFFDINGLSYALLSNGRFVRLTDNKVYSGDAIDTSNGSIAVSDLLGNNWYSFHTIQTTDGVLTVDTLAAYNLVSAGDAAFVVGSDSAPTIHGGASFPTEIYGTLTYTGSVYSLTTEGKSKGTSLKGVVVTSDAQPVEFGTYFLSLPISVGSGSSPVAEFNVTNSSESFTVNYTSNKVSVDTVATAINLTSGMLYISDPTQTVTAGTKKFVANSSDDISVNYNATDSLVTVGAFETAGEAVTVNGTPYTFLGGDGFDIIVGSSLTTLNGVDVGDTFNVGSTSYIMTSIGLATNDQTKLHKTIQSPTITSFTTDTLASSYWNTIYSAPDGVLTIAADNRPDNAQVVDLSDPTNAATYGYINYSGGVHTFTYGGSSSSDIRLTTVSIASGVVANLDSVCSDINITVPNATIIASASSAFTVNTRDGSYAAITAPIEVTAGTVQGGYSSNPVTVQGKVITVTNDTKTVMTVGINGSSAFVGGLDAGDTFTIGTDSYIMKSAGLFKNDTLRVYGNDSTFWLDNEDARKIINIDNAGGLSLRGETEDALVYNVTSTTKLAELSVGSEMSLSGVTSASPAANIKNVYIDASTVFNVDFTTKVNAPSGTVTVNDNVYNAVGSIVISAAADDSSLYGGTVSLESDESVQASNGTLNVVAGAVGAMASLGNFTTIDGLDAGEIFEFGGYTYTQTDVGLMRGDGTISEGLSGASVTISDLSTKKFVNVLAVTDGELDLSTVTANNSGVYDSATAPTEKYAELTVSGGTRYTLSDYLSSASSAIKTVDINTSTTLTADFVTNVSTSAAGSVTVNRKNYVGNTALTVKSDGTTSTLYDGTLTLDATKTATNSAVADETLKAVSGSISATASDGAWTELGDIANDESFELGGITYTQKGAGLTKGGNSICEALAGETIYISDLNAATWTAYVTTDSSNVLALSKTTANANIYNNDVTTGFGAVTVSGSDYTFNYASLSVRAAAGSSVTVNGAAYTGATALIINTTDDSSTLYGGTVNITNSDTVTAGDITVSGTSGTITATASGGSWASLGSLDSGDIFTVDGTTYQVSGTDLFELVSGSPGKLYDGTIRNGSISYSELSGEFSTIYTLTNGILDLTTTTFDVNDPVIVVESASALTTRVADLTYTGSGYSLGERDDGVLTNFAGVSLGSNARVLDTDIDTNVFTNVNTTYTVNGASFVALGSLSIATADNTATLSKGKVSLRENYSVTVTDGDTIRATTGTVTVDVGDNVTIGALNNADVFSVNGTSYIKTSIGLATGDNASLNTAIASTATQFTTDDLAASNWIQTYSAEGGALSIATSTPKNARVVDLSTPGNAVTYGTLTYSGVGYGLTLDDTSDTAPTSVDIASGVIATLPADCSDIQITVPNATLTAQSSSDFTVDARSTNAIISVPITLTAGTVLASIGAAVTAQSKVITATNDTKTAMTIGVSGASAFIGGLDAGDTFTIDGASYIMKSTGLFKNDTERVHDYTATFWLDEENSANVINVSGTNLDITSQTDHALVYNSGNTLQLGSLSVIGNEMTLSGLSNAPANIKTVDIAANTDLTVDFTTKVNAPSGTVTVNDNVYNAVGSIVISAAADDSSLYGGTVALESGDTLATANGDTVSVGTGPVNVTAALGKVSQFSELDTGDSFTFGGKTYTQADLGLMYGDTICESLNGSFTATNLNNGKFVDILTPVDGGLNLSTITSSGNVYDDADSPAVKYAALTVSSDTTRYTLNDSGSASSAIETVDIAAGKTLVVDFSTMVNAPTGTVTVNGDRYNAAGNIVISAVDSDSTLYDGIVTLDKTNPTASATYNGSLTVSNGSISATATLGYFTAIYGLDTGESFTFDGVTYTQTDIGLRNGSFVAEALSGSEIALDDLENVTWNHYLTTGSDGVLTLSDVDAEDADVYNYDLTARLGSVTKSDDVYTFDYAGQVRAAAGSVTVNGAAYTALNTIIIDTTADSSTLTTGTVSLASGDTVATTSEHTIANTAGDGLTVNASGSAVTFGALNSGDSFTADDNTYTVAVTGPMNSAGELWRGGDYSDGLTIAALETASNWRTPLVVSDKDLFVDTGTLVNGEEVILVDNATSPTETYGTLSRDSDGRYTLTVSDGDELLSGLTVSGVVMDVDNDLASDDVAITTVNADNTETKFTVSPARGKEYFTVDATGNIPKIEDAGSVEVTDGKITTGDNIPVTIAEDADNPTIVIGNGTHKIGGQTVTLADNDDDVEVTLADDGTISSISPLDKDATVTIDGDTYTSPADNSTLNYNDADGWFFDDYVPESGAYTITVDKNGNITVDTGVKFTDVVSSGRTLPTDATIQLAADVSSTPVTLINLGTTAINLTDADGNSLVASLGKIGGVLFDDDGAEFDSLDEARGATFTLDDEQSLTAGTTVITANADDVEVTIGRRNRLTVKGDISAVNATIDLSTSDTIKFDGMSLSGAGTAIFDGDGALTVTDGTTATSATGKTFTVYGTVTVDGKIVNAATSAALTATACGLTVGRTALTVTGDDAYTVNIDANASITGVENLGSATGVTVSGLTNATLLTDTAGALTVDKTFTGGASVLYTVSRGKVTAADGVTTIAGDFANGVAVNETPYTISGGIATINATADNVTVGAGTYGVNGKTYTTSTQTTFTLSDGTVTGADMDGDGNFAIHQDETGFALDDETLSLSGNDVVTLGVASAGVNTADGVEGVISGLGTATVNDIGDATINGTAINIDGDSVTAHVADGTVTALTGADDGATITSAPNMTITAGNGSYNFPNGDWTIDDTLDGSADFLTDGTGNVIGVDNLAGSLNAASGSVTINDADFGTTSDNVTVATDGTDITGVYGLSNGDSVGGSLSQVTFTMPEGSMTVNGAAFTLSGDSDVTLADDAKTIDGMDVGSVITLGSAGEYAINGTSVTAEAGDVYAINRDGLYQADADDMPITEGTPYANILALGESSSYVDESASGAQSIILGNRDEVALIDSPDAPTNVTTGSGNDSVVVRHGAQATIDTSNGDNTLIITNGKVTLENYSASNASVQTFDYSNVPAAVRNNSIKFGNGVMTLGDGVITFDASASVTGSTLAEIVDASGNAHNVGFTHTAGGTLNTSAESGNYLLKGNYAEKSTDTQKSAGSTIYGGSGNDTLLIGANDFANAGGGTNQIYITDPSLRSAAATIVLSDGTTNVRNFNDGFNTASDVIQVSDMSALEFGAGNAGLTMTSGEAQMTFSNLTPAQLVNVSGANNSMNAAGGYELKLQNGGRNYNVAVAQDGNALAVTDAANIYYGNSNGLSFTEYTGTVAVNLSNGTGTIGGTAATINGGATKLAAGSGDATLTGSDANETFFGGLGNATIDGGAGADLMVGNTSSLKSGSTKFIYTGGNGLDTIRNMDFMANAGDAVSDEVLVDVNRNVITSVNVNGSNVLIGLNGDASDNLTIANARGQHFKFNDLITKVDTIVAYDGYTDCYVGVGSNPTVRVAANMGDVSIWLSGGDDLYLGDISAINASAATGNNTLAGNDLNNLIIGGRGKNSIWGGEFATNDTLVGGSGQNTFFFQYANGQDVIQNAHDGDVVELVALTLDNIASTAITGNGLSIDLKDGSRLEVQSAANVEYKLADGTSYTADHSAREWRQK